MTSDLDLASIPKVLYGIVKFLIYQFNHKGKMTTKGDKAYGAVAKKNTQTLDRTIKKLQKMYKINASMYLFIALHCKYTAELLRYIRTSII